MTSHHHSAALYALKSLVWIHGEYRSALGGWEPTSRHKLVALEVEASKVSGSSTVVSEFPEYHVASAVLEEYGIETIADSFHSPQSRGRRAKHAAL